jgi:transcriptional regulator GlxA family with amidase domain
MSDQGQSVHTVGFLLVDNFTMIAFSACVDTLRLANYVTGQQLFAWRLYSKDGKPAPASNGISVSVDGSFNDVGPMPDVIVCAGIDVHRLLTRDLIARLRRLSLYGTSIGSVCMGTYVLAKAGLLDGYRCTTHWESIDALSEEFPGIEVTDELFEVDRNRFTCAGGTAAIDMMLARIAAKAGPNVAAAVTDNLIHHRQRESDERQRMQLRTRLGVANPKVLQVVELMEKNLETPISCADLAELAKLSSRQLERLFRKHFNETPTRYYLRLRLSQARQLLLQTSMPILPIGIACGFVSASHFSKSYSDFFGKTPTEERSGVKHKRKAAGSA